MAKTRIKDRDIAPKIPGIYDGIQSDKITDADPNDNKFLSAAERAAIVGGGNADPYHYHTGVGAISVQFGQFSRMMAGQFMHNCGVPSNVSGILVPRDGKFLSAAVALGEAVAGTAAHIQILAGGGQIGLVVINPGDRIGSVVGPEVDFVAGQELRCKILQGEVFAPSVLVEIRWR